MAEDRDPRKQLGFVLPGTQTPFDAEASGDDDDWQRKRKARIKERRHARARADEIKELNITAMMDMMTIILVFLLKSYMASSVNVTLNDSLQIPRSLTQTIPKDNINVTISLRGVAVNEVVACPIHNGSVPSEFREEGGLLIHPVFEALKKEVAKQKYIAKYNAAAQFTGRVNIIADKRVPYHTLLEVLYTAGQAELGQYKLMALKND